MDNLEKVDLENILPSISHLDFIKEWVGEHMFEILLVFCILALVIYKYSKKELSIATEYKSFLDNFNYNLNNIFGKFWLASNMEGNAIKSKVSFNDDDNEEYSDDEEEIKQVMHI